MSAERQKIARASANLKQQQARLGEVKSNAQKEFNRRSWFEFFTGKSSYADNERRQNALDTLRKTRNQWIISRNKESILDKRKHILDQNAEDMAQYYQSRVR
jgi:Mg2+/Co2+ transporter CorC